MILSSNDNDLQGQEPSDNLLHLEPIFWGTSDLLVWNPRELIATIDKNDHLRTAGTEHVLDPRGIYGYFPVIVENGGLVVLDPSDFHSELLILKAASGGKNDAALFKRLHPDGDVIAFGAVTIGCGGENYLDTTADVAVGNGGVLHRTGNVLVNLLENKITAEIRKGLGLTDKYGKLFLVDKALDTTMILPALFEMMSFEERLGISFDTNGKIIPEYSSVTIFIHHC
jgi:hypothetical protein